MCLNAAQQLNVLQRCSKFLSVKTRLLIVKFLIQSNFNYCPLVWHFCREIRKTPIQSSQDCLNDVTSSYEGKPTLNKVSCILLYLENLLLKNQRKKAVWHIYVAKLSHPSETCRYLKTKVENKTGLDPVKAKMSEAKCAKS